MLIPASIPQFSIRELQDTYIRHNFELLLAFLRTNSPFLGFEFLTQTYTAPVTNGKMAHNLSNIPKDVILTSLTGSGVVVFNYAKFDSTNLDITVSGTVTKDNPTTIRFFTGTYNPSP